MGVTASIESDVDVRSAAPDARGRRAQSLVTSTDAKLRVEERKSDPRSAQPSTCGCRGIKTRTARSLTLASSSLLASIRSRVAPPSTIASR